MPAYTSLALRYLAWLIGLRVVYALGVALLGLPHLISTDVILSAVPLLVIGTFVARTATRPIGLADWAIVWALCLAVFVLLMVMGPIAMALFSGADLSGTEFIRRNITVVFSTAVMMAVFLLIGARIRR